MGFLFWNNQRGSNSPPPVVFEPPEKPLEKIGLKHLIMPYVILLVGVLASLAVFSYEICSTKCKDGSCRYFHQYFDYVDMTRPDNASTLCNMKNLDEERCRDDDTNDDMDGIDIAVLD